MLNPILKDAVENGEFSTSYFVAYLVLSDGSGVPVFVSQKDQRIALFETEQDANEFVKQISSADYVVQEVPRFEIEMVGKEKHALIRNG